MRPLTAAMPGEFWRVWAVVGAGRLAQFIEPFLPVLLLVDLGATTLGVASVLLAAQLAATVGVAVAGVAVDAWGPRTVLRLGLVDAALAGAGLAAASSTSVAALAAVGYGIASASWRAAGQAIVPISLAQPGVPPRARAMAFGLMVWASNLGAVVSAAVGAAGAPVRPMITAQAAALLLTAVAARILAAAPSAPAASDSAQGRPPVVLRPRLQPIPDAGLWLVALAVTPATALMFQAFSGLAVVLGPDDYRTMVLINALAMIAGQPLVAWAARRFPAGPLLGLASVGLGVGLALHAWNVPIVLAVPVWTLAELAVVSVPSAVVAGLAPHARAGAYVGTFQAVQGGVAAGATYAGPIVAAGSIPAFAAVTLVVGVLGAVLLTAVRRLVQTGLDQPVDCPCGAVLCRCGGKDLTCIGPAPLMVHIFRGGRSRTP